MNAIEAEEMVLDNHLDHPPHISWTATKLFRMVLTLHMEQQDII
jgi:hypothetical protein